jgi:glycosyltransferase involved in cell wall biosynthesis
MQTPSISIVLPFRNAQNTLSEAIESVIQQTCSDWELLLIDDHSEDHSTKAALEYAQKHPRIDVLRSPEPGIVHALNTGIRHSQSRWIARMDADDLCAPKRLEQQLQFALRHPETTVFSCLVKAFPQEVITEGMARYIAWLNNLVRAEDIANQLYVESPIAHPSAFFCRQAVLDIGGYRDGLFPEDYDLWLRLHEKGHRFEKVPEVLLYWREHSERLSRTDPRYDLSHFRSLKTQSLKRSFLRDHDRVHIWGAGRDGKALRKALLKQDISVACFFDIDPRKIGGRVAGVVPVHHWKEALKTPEIPLLCAVGVKGAREEIRAALIKWEFREGREFLFLQ